MSEYCQFCEKRVVVEIVDYYGTDTKACSECGAINYSDSEEESDQ